MCVRPLCGACVWVRGTCSQHAGAAVAEDPRVLRGSPHSFERKRVPPLFLLSAPMVGGRDWSSGGRARDAPAARARRREDAARAAALTERAALTSFDRPPIVIKRTFPRGVSPWDVSHSAPTARTNLQLLFFFNTFHGTQSKIRDQLRSKRPLKIRDRLAKSVINLQKKTCGALRLISPC